MKTKKTMAWVLMIIMGLLALAVYFGFWHKTRQPFRLHFLRVSQDTTNGLFAVFEMEHDLPYNLGAAGARLLPHDAKGTAGVSCMSSNLQLPPGRITPFEITLPPSGGQWRLSLFVQLPGNPGFEAHRPLKVRVADWISRAVNGLPLPSSWKSACARWSLNTREVCSEAFLVPATP